MGETVCLILKNIFHGLYRWLKKGSDSCHTTMLRSLETESLPLDENEYMVDIL